MDIDDQLLLDHEGEFRSGQPSKPDVPEEEKEAPNPTKSTSSSSIRLSPNNWAVVKRLSNKSREIVTIRERTKTLLRRSQSQLEQRITPNWLPSRINPPLLPGTVAFSSDFQEEWRTTVSKNERRLLKKVTKHLPSVITGLELRLDTHRRTALSTLQREISDQQQLERAKGLFLSFTSKAEQEAPLIRRTTKPHQPKKF